jgi:hypothetical protein
MTALKERKTNLAFQVEAEIRECGRYRKIVLEPKPFFLEVRLSGTRTRFPVSYEAIYQLAARIAADRERAERKERRKMKGRR